MHSFTLQNYADMQSYTIANFGYLDAFFTPITPHFRVCARIIYRVYAAEKLLRDLKTVTHREAEIAGIGIRQLIVERSDDVAVRRADASDAVLLVAAIHDMAV